MKVTIIFLWSLSLILLITSSVNGFVSFISPNHHYQQKHNSKSFLNEGSASARDAIDWFSAQELNSHLPKEDTLSIINELLSEKQLIDDSKTVITNNYERFEKRLKDEDRPLNEILGKETTDRILKSVEGIESYDAGAVKAFLSSEAINKLFTQVLYDGIYQFFQTIDVFGNIIGRLPIIGPIRNQIRDEAKKSLDRTVGPLIQGFLREYTKVAVAQASDFVLKPSNRKVFSSANVKLISTLLQRPVNTLIPSGELSVKLIDELFEYLHEVKLEDIEEYVDFVYELLGDKNVDYFTDVNKVIDASPTLQKTLDRIWGNAINASTREEKD